MPVARPCLDCGTPTARGSRCRHCEAAAQAPYNDPQYQRARREAIAAEPWCHNPRCPYDDAGTPANPLTADHVVPLRWSPPAARMDGGLTVLCRRCNSAKRDRPAGGVNAIG